MERWSGRVALVTGASSGIGAAVAEKLVRNGMVVVGCGRNVAAIHALSDNLKACPGALHGIQCDLKSEEQILSMFKEINEKHGGLDVCINNAGLAKVASLVEGKTQDWKDMIDVNVLALSICTREALKSMKAKGVDDGHIINVCSINGHKYAQSAGNHWYGAVKFMVTSLTENLRIELRSMGSRIRASQISPGLVHTDFANRMVGERSVELFKTTESLTADQVAGGIVFMLAAEPNMEVHDMIVRPTSQAF